MKTKEIVELQVNITPHPIKYTGKCYFASSHLASVKSGTRLLENFPKVTFSTFTLMKYFWQVKFKVSIIQFCFRFRRGLYLFALYSK